MLSCPQGALSVVKEEDRWTGAFSEKVGGRKEAPASSASPLPGTYSHPEPNLVLPATLRVGGHVAISQMRSEAAGPGSLRWEVVLGFEPWIVQGKVFV